MFKEAGIKKSDLEDAETAKMIFSTISDALSQQVVPEAVPTTPPRPSMPSRPNTQPPPQSNRPIPPPPSLAVPSSISLLVYLCCSAIPRIYCYASQTISTNTNRIYE